MKTLVLYDQHGRQIPVDRPAPQRRTIRARFDAAENTGPHVKHWQGADSLSPDLSANAAVRKTMRNRCRYEVYNNSYAAGIVNTLANYVIGTGPTLRMVPAPDATKRQKEQLARMAADYNRWAWDVQLAQTLHTLQRAKSVDGEGFAMLVTTPVERYGVTLDVVPFEADMCTDGYQADSLAPDGVRVGPDGRASSYMILSEHPGGSYSADLAKPYPAGQVVHWFDPLRAGLHRGIPEIVPALMMFAQLRRYTSAVVTAAEFAADFSGVLQTDAPPGEAVALSAADEFPIERGTILSAPNGWKLAQLKAEHPGPEHEQFLRCIIREIGRCLDMPYAVAAMDASGHNYSSMRGDWQAFFAAIRVRRYRCEQQALDKILNPWAREWQLSNGVALAPGYDYVWDWPAAEVLDPYKEAMATKVRLESMQTTYAEEYAKRGLPWMDSFQQAAIERSVMRELNLSVAPAAPPEIEDDDEEK